MKEVTLWSKMRLADMFPLLPFVLIRDGFAKNAGGIWTRDLAMIAGTLFRAELQRFLECYRFLHTFVVLAGTRNCATSLQYSMR